MSLRLEDIVYEKGVEWRVDDSFNVVHITSKEPLTEEEKIHIKNVFAFHGIIYDIAFEYEDD